VTDYQHSILSFVILKRVTWPKGLSSVSTDTETGWRTRNSHLLWPGQQPSIADMGPTSSTTDTGFLSRRHLSPVAAIKHPSWVWVQLYLYSPYGPYGLYRASVPIQYSYTSTPPPLCLHGKLGGDLRLVPSYIEDTKLCYVTCGWRMHKLFIKTVIICGGRSESRVCLQTEVGVVSSSVKITTIFLILNLHFTLTVK